jgi:hypothetical protein
LADAVALVSIASSAAVALGVPLINARLEQRRLRFQRDLNQLDELRSVIDETATELENSLRQARVVEFAVEAQQSPCADGSEADTVAASLAALDNCRAHLAQMSQRLAVRLGPDHRLVSDAHDAQRRLDSAYEILSSAAEGGPASDDPTEWHEVVAPLYVETEGLRAASSALAEHAAHLIGPEF